MKLKKIQFSQLNECLMDTQYTDVWLNQNQIINLNRVQFTQLCKCLMDTQCAELWLN